MVIGHLGGIVVLMAINTTERSEITGYGMTLDALIPFILVFSAVYREILLIVVKSGRRPGAGGMTFLAGGWVTFRKVVRVIRRIVIRRMASEAGIGGVVVVAVVTIHTGDCGMRPVQNPERIVDRERSRLPVRRSSVAHRAIRRQVQGNVVGVGTRVVIRCMTARAGVRRVGIIAVVTGVTIVGDGNMRSGKRIIYTMVKRGRHPGRLAVASGAIGRELRSRVVRIRGRIVIRRVTAKAVGRRIVVIPVVTRGTAR